MKAQSLLYAAVAAIVCLSCTREAEGTTTLAEGIELEFTAAWADEKSTADAETDSRTVLQEDGTSIWWTANEEINAFFGSRFAGRFTSTNTSTVATAAFQGTLNVLIGTIEEEGDLSKYWAVYPYNANNTCDGHSVTLTVASEQTASAGTFADKFFPAVANSKTLELAFYNVCGGARFSVTQEGVTKVIFKSNGGSPMAGKVKVGFGEDNKPQILEITEPVDSVVVDAPEGGFVPGTNYFAAMLPQAHAEGITIILRTQDKKATRMLANAVTVNRSSFGMLDDVDSGLEYVDDEVQPGTNPDDFIQFEDPIAKYACVEKFDTNGDGEVSYAEAAAATSLIGLFTDWNTVTSFDEIRYFTGITSTANVFTGLPQLKRITIPDNITTLGTFKNCTSLKSVLLPTSITAIPDYAFQNCSSLETLNIPTTITSIGQYAFSGCKVLAGMNLPYGLKKIGEYAFQNCQALASLDFPSSLTSIGKYVCSGCTALMSVTLGNGVKLGEYAFSDCIALTTVVLPGDMTSIPERCFQNCSSLANITWPNALTDIGGYAFKGCFVSEDPAASKIELPSTIKSIGSGAFWGVRHLIMPSVSPISIASDSFLSCYTRLYVPSGMVEMYKIRTNWSAYKNLIYSINDYPVTTAISYCVPEAVDLGLSVKWASFNLGASSPEHYGAYFAWGETEPKYDYSWSTYKWCMGSYNTLTKYCNKSSYGYNNFKDNKTVLAPEDDAALVNLGGSWRMPTLSEINELSSTKQNASYQWEKKPLNGYSGWLITYLVNNNSIFLPSSGYRDGTSLSDARSRGHFWCSALYTGFPTGAYYMNIHEFGVICEYDSHRFDGRSVRPVCCD